MLIPDRDVLVDGVSVTVVGVLAVTVSVAVVVALELKALVIVSVAVPVWLARRVATVVVLLWMLAMLELSTLNKCPAVLLTLPCASRDVAVNGAVTPERDVLEVGETVMLEGVLATTVSVLFAIAVELNALLAETFVVPDWFAKTVTMVLVLLTIRPMLEFVVLKMNPLVLLMFPFKSRAVAV